MSNEGGNSEVYYHPSALNSTRQIAERVWSAAENITPQAVAVLLHGGTFHGAWFGQLGDALAARNVRVSSPDFPAHGLSDDVVPGMRGYIPEFSKMTAEVQAAVARARDAVVDKSVPVFLFGESMGGLIATQAVIDGVQVNSLILSGAALEFAPALRPNAIARLFLHALAFARPHTAFPIPVGGDTYDKAFGDPEAAKKARDDPLVCDMAPPRAAFAAGAIAAQARVRREARNVRVKSVLLLHYENDGRTDQPAARAIFESMDVEDKVVHVVEGNAHQLFQDVPQRVSQHIDMVVDFVCARC